MQLRNLLTLLPVLGAALADSWSINAFTRDCTNPNICTYYFTISDPSAGVSQHCTTVDFYTPAGNHSWSNIPCEETSNYVISWGWNYAQDFTVMTVVYVPAQQEAFFGYNSPNAVNPVARYPNVGPNAVQSTGVVPSKVEA